MLPKSFIKNEQPFYHALAPFYDLGFHAVQLFFIHDRVLFFFLSIITPFSGKRELEQQLWVARFSRLYPLHASDTIDRGFRPIHFVQANEPVSCVSHQLTPIILF